MSLFIEFAEVPDPATAPALSLQAAQLVLETIGNYKQTRDTDSILETMGGMTTLMALDGYGRVVSTAGLARQTDEVGVIDNFATDERLQGLGIGRRLISKVEDVAYRQGMTVLELESSSIAVSFYRYIGYTQLDDRKFTKHLTM